MLTEGDVEEGGEEEDDGDVLAAEAISTHLVVQQVLTVGASAITVPFVLMANIEAAVQERRVASAITVAAVLKDNIESAVQMSRVASVILV